MAGHAGGAIARIGNTLHPLRENGPERNIVKESEIIDEGVVHLGGGKCLVWQSGIAAYQVF